MSADEPGILDAANPPAPTQEAPQIPSATADSHPAPDVKADAPPAAPKPVSSFPGDGAAAPQTKTTSVDDDDSDAALAKAMRAGLDKLNKVPQDSPAVAPDAKGGGAETPPPPPAADAPKTDAADEFAGLAFREDPAFKKLVAERDQARTGAAEFERIQQFVARTNLEPEMVNVGFAGLAAMRETGMTAEEMHTAFQVVRTLRENPAAGLRMLQPYLEEAQAQAAKNVPSDIREMVDSGLISEEAAAELQALRTFKEQATVDRQLGQQAAATQAEVANIQATVQAWAADWQKKDPDARTSHKQRLVLEGVSNRLYQFTQANPGRRPTPDQVLAICSGVVDAVNKDIAAIAGTAAARRQKDPRPAFGSNGGVVSSDAPTKPKTLEEALLQGYKRAS